MAQLIGDKMYHANKYKNASLADFLKGGRSTAQNGPVVQNRNANYARGVDPIIWPGGVPVPSVLQPTAVMGHATVTGPDTLPGSFNASAFDKYKGV